MSMPSFRIAILLTAVAVAASVLPACTGSKVVRGDGQTIEQARAERYDGPKYRIAVGNIIDKTDPLKEASVARQIAELNAKRPADQQLEASGITAGIRDLLVTELFNSGQFIVLERDALNTAIVEQEFSQSARVGDETRIPRGELEGAELLVVGALTAFDAGLSGAAIPIPIPLAKNFSSFGVMSLSFKRGFAALDLRIIDAATGRIVASTAVEGRNTSYGLDLQGVYGSGFGYVPLPGVLGAFSKTPVEAALQKMVTAAIGKVAEQKPSKTITTPLPSSLPASAVPSKAVAPVQPVKPVAGTH
ncbi:MAG: CsgG/HfaB family protein [Nevskia sp.]|nr:CsgG/HfaB family protein [Nevskia sp.]